LPVGLVLDFAEYTGVYAKICGRLYRAFVRNANPSSVYVVSEFSSYTTFYGVSKTIYLFIFYEE